MSEIKVNSIKGVAASAAAISVDNSNGTCTLASGSKLNNCTTDGTTNLTVADGNLVIGTAGHGIDFSASSNVGGMTSETLTDYEEGTWTPTSNVGAITTYSAHYVKVGKTVTVQAYIEFPSMSGSSGANFGSFPFSSGSGDDRYSCLVASNTNFGGYQLAGVLSGTTLEVSFLVLFKDLVLKSANAFLASICGVSICFE